MSDWFILGIKLWQIVTAYFIIVIQKKQAHPQIDSTMKKLLNHFSYISHSQIAHTFNKEQSLLSD